MFKCGEKRKALLEAEFGDGQPVDKPQITVDKPRHIANPSLSLI
jgi:hypothetical protein